MSTSTPTRIVTVQTASTDGTVSVARDAMRRAAAILRRDPSDEARRALREATNRLHAAEARDGYCRAYDTVTEWSGPVRATEAAAAKDAQRHNDGCAKQGDYGSAIVVRRDPERLDRLVTLEGETVWPPSGRTSGAARWLPQREHTMAAIYDYETGDLITGDLQGWETCDEAIDAARAIAAERDAPVELHDDGRWRVNADGSCKRLGDLEDGYDVYVSACAIDGGAAS